MIVVLLLGLTIAGCGSSESTYQKTNIVGKKTLFRPSKEKPPEWTQKERRWVVKGKANDADTVYFKGVAENQVDLFAGTAMAKADAIKNLGESIRTDLEVVFGTRLEGNATDKIAQYMNLMINTATRDISARLSTIDDYWEEYEVGTYDGVTYKYDIWSLNAIPEKEFNKYCENAFSKAKQESEARQDEEIKQKLEQGQREFLKRLEQHK